jgi:hypothetical protein
MIAVSSYEKAHKIVDSNRSLFWDGWTIVEFKPSRDSVTSKNAIFKNGRWGYSKRFEPGENGWKVPGKYVR